MVALDDVRPRDAGRAWTDGSSLRMAVANRVLQNPMKPLSECRLYAFVDTAYLGGRAPEVVAQQLCDGGADLIQLRAKDFSLDAIRRMADTILPITRNAGIGLVINDHPAIAQQPGAELCHLGQEDFFGAGFQCAFGLSGSVGAE